MKLTLRTVAIGAVLVLGVASCGVTEEGGSGTSPVTPTTKPPATTTVRPTTTSSTSSTTTTTIPPTPWLDVEFPPMPPATLTPMVGGPYVVRTVCLDMALDGYNLDGIGDLQWVLEQLGLEVVDSGCDVTLKVDVSGTRVSARYTRGGSSFTCWSGYRMSGEVTLLGGAERLAGWAMQRSVEPPYTISSCTDEDAPLPVASWAVPTAVALTDSFGAAAGVLSHVRLAPQTGWNDDDRVDTLRSDPAVGTVLAALLGDDDQQVRYEAATQIEAWASAVIFGGGTFPAELWSTIPYLVAGGLEPDDGDANRQALSMLFFLSPTVMPVGFTPYDPAAWWELWEARPTP